MKIISWNCNMAFRRKAEMILKYNPDILIVPECESNERLNFSMFSNSPNNILWFGKNQNKGLGIFSYSDYEIKLQEWYNPNFKTIVPLAVKNKLEEFILFAIWAYNPEDEKYKYIGQVWKAINYYKEYLDFEKVFLIGDFNSNTIWDKPRRVGNHSSVVQFLEERNIYSLYHQYYKEKQGQENQPTLFMYRHKDKSYHIDYCFASKYFMNKIKCMTIGQHCDWNKMSDHMPIIAEFF